MFRFTGRQTSENKSKGTRNEVFAYKRKVRLVSTAVAFVIVFSLVIAVYCYYLASYFSTSELNNNEKEGKLSDSSLRAALIDALHGCHPNEEFTKSVNETLLKAGFDVDIYEGEEVTVEFLKRLKGGYKLIILRMHSALSSDHELYLFTAEQYSVGKYVQEQRFRLVKEAYATKDSQPVFAVNWGFVKKLMTGKFNGTLVIVMGCDGALDKLMAQEFMNQGAVGYVAWNGPVLLSHSDKAVLRLVQTLYVEKLPLEDAIEKTQIQIGEDPNWGTVLDVYLPQT